MFVSITLASPVVHSSHSSLKLLLAGFSHMETFELILRVTIFWTFKSFLKAHFYLKKSTSNTC